MIDIAGKLFRLYYQWQGCDPDDINPLPQSGSVRKYYRLSSGGNSAIAAFNPDPDENRAFIELSRHFRGKGLNVPEIYASDMENNIYLQQDLGDRDMFSYVDGIRKEKGFNEEILSMYKLALDHLLRFQLEGDKNLSYSVCYPRPAFDNQAIQWDLNYFKYYFLRMNNIAVNENRLQDDINEICECLGKNDLNFFMYRDFQTRNIMLHNNDLYFIDYQGGRKGPLQYDLASILFSSKANIPVEYRKLLVDYYIDKAQESIDLDADIFREQLHAVILLRILQMLGAYGFRGLVEGKSHFIKSIPFAIINLDIILAAPDLPLKIPEIRKARELFDSLNIPEENTVDTLNVKLSSFSFKKGYPTDYSGHGGGFVFDCRALPNPGREAKYRPFTGKDSIVIQYLESRDEVKEFLKNAMNVVAPAVEKYIERGFSNLSVAFGCTGGQHRSVYCAEKFAVMLEDRFIINIITDHREQN